MLVQLGGIAVDQSLLFGARPFFDLRLADNGLGFGGVGFAEGKFHGSSVGGIVSTLSGIVRGEALLNVFSVAHVKRTIGTEKDVGCSLHAFALRLASLAQDTIRFARLAMSERSESNGGGGGNRTPVRIRVTAASTCVVRH